MARLGDYELEEEIGRGGMGRVFRARHLPTGAVRAVKVIAGANVPEAVARFRREAEALARVGPGVAVRVHEAGQESGRTFYAMELLPGGSLARKIEPGKLPWRDAVRLVVSIARAVARCHDVGIVHRDLKPANVLFDERDEPRLVDFGCARDLAAATLTETGTALGTPSYMATEQLDGGRGDERSDVYALGVMLHELVTGVRPYLGPTWREILFESRRGYQGRSAAAAGAPASLDRILARALEPDPAARIGSASELGRELETLVSKAPAEPKRAPAPRLVVLVALVAGVVGVALMSRPWGGRAEPAAPPAGVPVARVDDATTKRLVAGEGTLHELEAYGRSKNGAEPLRDVIRRAVVYPPDVVHAARALVPDSEELALLDAIATLASSTEDSERGPAGALIERSKLGGDLDLLRVALREMRAIVARAGKVRERIGVEWSDPEVLAKALSPLARRSELVTAAVGELDSSCRTEIARRHADFMRTSLNVVLRPAVLLEREGLLELLPPHVVISYVTCFDPNRRGRLERGAPLRARLCVALERAARELETKEPLVAGRALVEASLLGDFPPRMATVDVDAAFARRLLVPLTEGDGRDAFFALHELHDLGERAVLDAANQAHGGTGSTRALEEGLAAAEECARNNARYRALLASAHGDTLESAERPPAGQCPHIHALFLLALGGDASGVRGLVRDDPLERVVFGHDDPDGIERAALRVVDRMKTEEDVPAFLVRCASAFLDRPPYSIRDKGAADTARAASVKLLGLRELDWIEKLVAAKRIP